MTPASTSPAAPAAPVGPARRGAARPDPALTPFDLHLLAEGTHYRLHRHLGAHPAERDGRTGIHFAVWAPDAAHVSVVGDFNHWAPDADVLEPVGSSGVHAGFVPGLERGTVYKYHVVGRHRGDRVDKADPVGFLHEHPPATASRVWDLDFAWSDADWMAARGDRQGPRTPLSIYELHLGSWMRHPDHGRRVHAYEELADLLPGYVRDRGFTHVELLPVMEHPLTRSWGYQTTGYFAPTSRFGTPQGLMTLIDRLHAAGIGVILDWVPSHFPSDEHGPGSFDGTHLYEHADPRLGFHPDWKSLIFNYGRNEVRAFLISSALFWLEHYHVDGLRVDAVASMLYLDYSRGPGEWIPNRHGGRENLEAIDFLQRLNVEVHRAFPDVLTFAEESTAWPGVTAPVVEGGLGFDFKWDMGWMNDTLRHLARDPVHRRHHHEELTFRGMYMHAERYVLPLSHDEVVHGKGSLLGRMAGDEWRKRANLRLLLADQWLQPGKKLLFMGGEIGQLREWDEEREVDWFLLSDERHAGIRRLVDRLNELHRLVPALHELDHDPAGFRWLDADDREHGLLSFLRLGAGGRDAAVCVLNLAPVVREDVLVGAPDAGTWHEILNTDAREYGGSGVGNLGRVETRPLPRQGEPHVLRLTVPPLAALVLRRDPGDPPA